MGFKIFVIVVDVVLGILSAILIRIGGKQLKEGCSRGMPNIAMGIIGLLTAVAGITAILCTLK